MKKEEIMQLSKLHGLLRENGTCDGNIIFYAAESNQTKLAIILNNADYLVTTSIIAEMFNLNHIKSLIMLTPVITFDVGSNAESTLFSFERAVLSGIQNDNNDNIYLSTSSLLIENIAVSSLAEKLLSAFVNKQNLKNCIV